MQRYAEEAVEEHMSTLQKAFYKEMGNRSECENCDYFDVKNCFMRNNETKHNAKQAYDANPACKTRCAE